MPPAVGSISGTIGDDIPVTRTITGVTATDPLVKVWLTLKTAVAQADPGALQKAITTSFVSGQGQIVTDGSVGSGNGTATISIDLTSIDTLTLTPLVTYVYDIKVKTQAGNIDTIEQGTARFVALITTTTT